MLHTNPFGRHLVMNLEIPIPQLTFLLGIHINSYGGPAGTWCCLWKHPDYDLRQSIWFKNATNLKQGLLLHQGSVWTLWPVGETGTVSILTKSLQLFKLKSNWSWVMNTMQTQRSHKTMTELPLKTDKATHPNPGGHFRLSSQTPDKSGSSKR